MPFIVFYEHLLPRLWVRCEYIDSQAPIYSRMRKSRRGISELRNMVLAEILAVRRSSAKVAPHLLLPSLILKNNVRYHRYITNLRCCKVEIPELHEHFVAPPGLRIVKLQLSSKGMM